MAKFLNTSGVTYHLEELIKDAAERLIIISPFLRFNDRMKELLQDKNRMKIDVRIVYGKSELAPQEINWLRSLEFVRTSFCQNLHAKCYLSESAAILTSMNLYDFSQVNNNEMGVFIQRDAEPDLYRDTYEEAQRLIRISEQVRVSAETVEEPRPEKRARPTKPGTSDKTRKPQKEYDKLSNARLAKAQGISTAELTQQLLAKKFLKKDGDKLVLTEAGTKAGGESISSRTGAFVVWPKDMSLEE
jgi:phosphatidylserine/phosphatidylglycerophosphate/cardiolipin synthase-like enzyme